MPQPARKPQRNARRTGRSAQWVGCRAKPARMEREQQEIQAGTALTPLFVQPAAARAICRTGATSAVTPTSVKRRLRRGQPTGLMAQIAVGAIKRGGARVTAQQLQAAFAEVAMQRQQLGVGVVQALRMLHHLAQLRVGQKFGPHRRWFAHRVKLARQSLLFAGNGFQRLCVGLRQRLLLALQQSDKGEYRLARRFARIAPYG